MGSNLGEGITRAFSDSSSSDSEDTAGDLQEIFRRHFESKFEPLEQICSLTGRTAECLTEGVDSSSDQPNWDGLSYEREEIVLVVEHIGPQIKHALPKAELRAFMVNVIMSEVLSTNLTYEQDSKPPSSDFKAALKKPSVIVHQGDESNQADRIANLKNDLLLHRLISESHLFDNLKDGTSTRNRQKITDLRLRSLGSKSSILDQERMPMAHRKGIVAKASQRNDRRRREAKDNGVTLETAIWKKKRGGMRIRSLGGPAVGKFHGGTLKLSRKDVAEIKGAKQR